MKKKSILLRSFAAAMALALLLAGCGSGDANGSAAPNAPSSDPGQSSGGDGYKVFRFGQAPYGDTLDMQISTNSGSAAIADEITESLLRFDDDNNLEPVLITDFPDISEDGTVYSFELKKGVYFTNGTELTASDVKFTFERMFTPSTGAKSFSYFDMIVGAKAMMNDGATELAGFEIQDDYHFTITLESPYAPFLKNLGTSYADIFPEDACTAAGENWGNDDNLIGTGPYKFQSNDTNTEAVLVKNENYHGGEVKLDEIHVKYYSDTTTKVLAFENDDIDACDLAAALLSQYKDSYGDQITAYHPLGTYFLSLNLDNDVLKDVKVRQAISLAINREELVEYVLDGAGIPATTYLNPAIPGHDNSLPVYEYNVEQAKQLLADAGYSSGLTIDGGKVRQSEETLATTVQGYLLEAGINLLFDVVDNATWTSERAGGKLPFTFISWNALYADGDFQMYNYFHSSRSGAMSVNYGNPEYDNLMDEARSVTDEAERTKLYARADEILSHEDMVCVPLYYPQSQFLAKPYVKDMKVGNLIYHMWNIDIDLDAQAAYNS